MATAADVITEAMRLFGIIDAMESPAAVDLANNSVILNSILRADHVDGAAQYLMKTVQVTMPPGANGHISSFSIGVAEGSYLVQIDAVALKSMWAGDVGTNVWRETRGPVPTVDVVRTTNLGIITKWRTQRQIDGSVLVTVWQPPRIATPLLLEYGGRVPKINASTDTVGLPPEGLHDAALLLGRRIFSSYGRSAQAVAAVLADSERVHARWTDWAKGQQWLRMLRA
jgi:hypothetical protein